MNESKSQSLEAGRKKLEELRAKKAALAAKRATSSVTAPPHPPPPPPPAPQLSAPPPTSTTSEEVQGLKEQIAELLQSVNDLHRALNDERYNSSQLEEQIKELREQKNATATYAALPISEEELAELRSELEEARASASRYAAAAEGMVAQVDDANERVQELGSEVASIHEYRARIDELESTKAAQEEHMKALTAQLSERDAEIASHIQRNQKMKEELVDQVAAAEQAVAAEEEEQASLDAERAKVAQLEEKVTAAEAVAAELRTELASTVELAMARQSEIEKLQSAVSVAEEAEAATAADAALVAEQQALLEELDAQLTAAREEAAELRGKLQETEMSGVDNQDAHTQTVIAERDALIQEVAVFESRLTSLQSSLDEARAEAQARGEEAQAATEALVTAQGSGSRETEMMRTKLDMTMMRAADMEGQLVEAFDAITGAEHRAQEAEREMKVLRGQAERALAEKKAAEAQQAEALAAIEELKAQLDGQAQAVTTTNEEAVAALEAAQAQITALNEAVQRLTEEKNELSELKALKEVEEGSMREQLRRANEETAVAEGSVFELQSQLASLAATVDALNQDKASFESIVQQLQTELQVKSVEASGGVATTTTAEVEAEAEALTALAIAQGQLAELQATVQLLTNEKVEAESQRIALETQVMEATERAAAAEAAGAEAAAAAQEAVSHQAQARADELAAQLAAALSHADALASQVTALEVQMAATASGSGEAAAQQRAEILQQEVNALHATVAEHQLQSQRQQERIRQLGEQLQHHSQQQQAPPQQHQQQQQQQIIAALQAEITSLRQHLETEKNRAAQLEAFSERQRAASALHPSASAHLGDKKDEDNALDMEAAALAGGSAFKPLVGVVRSLPSPLSHPFIVQAARELDRGAVALDARPHIRAGLIFYVLLLHVMLLI